MVPTDQSAASGTDMVSPEQAATKDHHEAHDTTTMGDTFCYLLPLSVAATREVKALLSRSSPHVQTIPDELKQHIEVTGGSEYCIDLRYSTPHKNPSAEFLFGADPSTCDICFMSKELSNVSFRINRDENGVVTVKDQSDEASGTGVYVSSPTDRRASIMRETARPLENASTFVIFSTETRDFLKFRVVIPLANEGETCEFSDVESVASVTDVPSLTSGTTFSSLGSQLDVSEATRELAKLLLNDDELGPLFRTSLQRTAADKIERNYTRLLAGFAKDLRKEATNPVEHHVGRLVKFRARFISQTLISAIDPSRRDRTAQFEDFLHQNKETDGRLEQFLESLAQSGDFIDSTKKAPPAIDSDGNVSDDSGEEGNLPKLSQIKDFILSSKALAKLRTRVKSFVSPEEITPGVMQQSDTRAASEGPIHPRLSKFEVLLGAVIRLVMRIDQRAVSALTDFLLTFVRPNIPEGHQRITWVCVSYLKLVRHSSY